MPVALSRRRPLPSSFKISRVLLLLLLLQVNLGWLLPSSWQIRKLRWRGPLGLRPSAILMTRSHDTAQPQDGSLATLSLVPFSLPPRLPVSGPTSPELISLCQQHLDLIAAIAPDKVSKATVLVPAPLTADGGTDPSMMMNPAAATVLASYPTYGDVASGAEMRTPSAVQVDGQLVMPLVQGTWLLGWLTVDRKADAGVWMESELALLGRVAGCITQAIYLDNRKRRNEEARLEKAETVLRETLQQIRSPLSALRTFGKLLARRLQREEGLNLELARNILVQSDRLVELINPFTAVVGLLGWAGGAEEEPVITDRDDDSSRAAGGDRGGEAADYTVCSMSDVLAPIFSAARALAARDGIHLACSVEEDLPAVVVDERLLQEALAHVVDYSFSCVLYECGGGGGGEGMPLPPAVRIEVLGLRASDVVVQVVVDVIDNGIRIGNHRAEEDDDNNCEEEEEAPGEARSSLSPPSSSGLVVAKGMVERMDGRLDLTTSVTAGERRVRITLPWSSTSSFDKGEASSASTRWDRKEEEEDNLRRD